MKQIFLSLCLLYLSACQENKKPVPATQLPNKEYKIEPADLSPSGFHWVHRDLALIYQKSIYQHNLEGKWDEKSLKPKLNDLLDYIDSLKQITPAEFSKWERVHQISFLINTYHAYLIKEMISKDFKNLDHLENGLKIVILGKVFNTKEFIRNELMNFDDVRLLFVLKCFSEGCPEFRNTIYNHKNLEKMLEVSSTRFFIDDSKNTYDTKTKTLTLSPYLTQYKDLLPKDLKVLQKLLAPYFVINKEMQEQMRQGQIKIIWK